MISSTLDLRRQLDGMLALFAGETKRLNSVTELGARGLDDDRVQSEQAKQLQIGGSVPDPRYPDPDTAPRLGTFRMTAADTERFHEVYDILEVRDNNAAGMAGVALLNKRLSKEMGEPVITLAIRSTEFLPRTYIDPATGEPKRDENGQIVAYGDYDRDWATNRETISFGFPFAQIDSATRWLDALAREYPGAKFQLVGASLSGAVVQTVSLLRPDLVLQAPGLNLAFHATGVGYVGGTELTLESVQRVHDSYREALLSPEAIDLWHITDEAARTRLEGLRNAALAEWRAFEQGKDGNQTRYDALYEGREANLYETYRQRFAVEYASQLHNTHYYLNPLGNTLRADEALGNFTARTTATGSRSRPTSWSPRA
jgi:pimeloyl-ACP methyl ester carboxylesterase